MKVERNDELSALYADAVANIVHVTLADGRTLTKRVDHPLGNAKNRLKDSEVEEKFFNLAAPKITKAGADQSGRAMLEAGRGRKRLEADGIAGDQGLTNGGKLDICTTT